MSDTNKSDPTLDAFEQKSSASPSSEDLFDTTNLDNEAASVDASSESEDNLNERIRLLESKIKELEKDNLVQKSDFVNQMSHVRQRHERDVQQAKDYSISSFVKNLLDGIDALDKAIALTEEHQNGPLASVYEGLVMTKKKFDDVMQKHGVVVMNPVGEAFDAELHEAVATIPHPEAEKGLIVDVVQTGCRISDRTVRPAKVVVSDGQP